MDLQGCGEDVLLRVNSAGGQPRGAAGHLEISPSQRDIPSWKAAPLD